MFPNKVMNPLNLICLDLDETLIHAETDPVMTRYIQDHQHEYVKLDHKIIPQIPHPPFILFFRPHVRFFLASLKSFKALFPNLKVVVTTAATKMYAKVVIRELIAHCAQHKTDISDLFDDFLARETWNQLGHIYCGSRGSVNPKKTFPKSLYFVAKKMGLSLKAEECLVVDDLPKAWCPADRQSGASIIPIQPFVTKGEGTLRLFNIDNSLQDFTRHIGKRLMAGSRSVQDDPFTRPRLNDYAPSDVSMESTTTVGTLVDARELDMDGDTPMKEVRKIKQRGYSDSMGPVSEDMPSGF